MPQVTLYLDEETDRKARASATAAGLSYSRWVTELIRARTQSEWPAEVPALAGSTADFPLERARRSTKVADLKRVPLAD